MTSGSSAEDGFLARDKATEAATEDLSSLDSLEARLDYKFADGELLRLALTHRSRTHEDRESGHGNERLEFLGDAVLDLLVSEKLMQAHPEVDEGMLSRARAGAVNTNALAARARELGLDADVRLGRGERRSGGAAKPSILANVFEAVLGAIYLDGGLAAAERLVEREFGADLQANDAVVGDAKTKLQELMQARGEERPRYSAIEESGPPHARQFVVRVELADGTFDDGSGGSKRVAEQAAARAALERLARDAS